MISIADDDLLAFRRRVGEDEAPVRARDSCAATLTDSPAVSGERARRRRPLRQRSCARGERAPTASVVSSRTPSPRSATLAAHGGAVVAGFLGPELRAERDQLAHVGDGFDRARGRQADEPLRVEVVAEQEHRVVVAGREEPAAVRSGRGSPRRSSPRRARTAARRAARTRARGRVRLAAGARRARASPRAPPRARSPARDQAAKKSAAASTVRSISSSPWASETNIASNCDGGT